MTTMRGLIAVRVFLSFAFAYFLSFAFRSVNAVIGSELQIDLSLSNAELGMVSAAYFLAFAALQLPLGIWLDKYGPRRTECSLLIVAAIGSATFAMSESLWGLWLGRALIGVGVAGCLMAPYKAYRLWFPAEKQAQLASWMLVAGTSGALATTIPVSSALPYIGWRGVFWIMSGLILLASATIFIVLKKVEETHPTQTPKTAGTPNAGATYGSVFRDRFFQRMCLLSFFNLASFSALQTLWAGPWMVTVLGMDLPHTSQTLFFFNLTLTLGYFCVGFWAPRFISYGHGPGIPVGKVTLIGIGLAIPIQAGIVFFTGSWSWLLWLLFALCITSTALTQTRVSLHFPPSSAGRANSSYNLTQFVGTFVMQWGIGVLADSFVTSGHSQSDAMRLAFACCLAAQCLSFIAFVVAERRAERT